MLATPRKLQPITRTISYGICRPRFALKLNLQSICNAAILPDKD